MRERIGWMLLAVCLLAPAAGATTTRPATPAAAEPWLARAEREIAGMPVDTPKEFVTLDPTGLAYYVYHLAPTADRRALVARLIDRAVKTEVDKKRSAEQVRGAYILGAWTHAEIGEADAARRLLQAADKPNGASPTTDPLVPLFANWNEMFRAETYLRLGNYAAFERVGLTVLGAEIVARDLRDDGLNDLAARATQWALKQAATASTRPVNTDDPASFANSSSRLTAVDCRMEAGDLAGAAGAAAAIEDNLPPGGTPPGGRDLCHAQVIVARGCLDAGDMKGFRAARDAIIAVAQKHPDSRYDDFHDLLDLCVRAKDRAGFAAVAGAWARQIGPEESNDPVDYLYHVAQLAAQYAAIGDRGSYLAAVEKAEKAIGSVTFIKDRATDYLWIAAARARAGDPAGVARDEAASRKAVTLDAGDWDFPWWDVVKGYADAGLFSDALAAAAKARDDTAGGMPRYIAHRQAKAGKFDDAWQTVGPLPTRNRVAGEYDLIVQQVQAGQVGGLAARIDAMKSPYERALADIGVAATLLGRPFDGTLRAYRTKGD